MIAAAIPAPVPLTKYTSIYDVRDIVQNFNNIDNLIHNIKVCITRGLSILNDYRHDQDLYNNYSRLINRIKNTDHSYLNLFNEPHFTQTLVDQFTQSIGLLHDDFNYNNTPGNIPYTMGSNHDYGKTELSDNINRIRILTNQILLTNILYLLGHKKSTRAEILIRQLRIENNLNTDEIQRLNNNLLVTRQGYTGAIHPNLKYIKENNYNMKFLKYYLKTFYLNLENLSNTSN
jgi:hypothetical protein